ncbi:MAG: tetratricopeptide repeat protein [Geobacteraceae bacterium]|nr:tetratricopeptide repeat protein [Geobacteraceae bacterium]NTW80274.1 tetratricopeptide repeat protein [Geobacteraceae bacterium]
MNENSSMGSDWLSASTSDTLGLAAASQSAESTRAQNAQYAIASASSALSDGNYDKAIKAFKTAAAFDPNNTTAYNYLGKIYLSQGKNDDAIKAYKQLVRIQSSQTTKDASSSAPTLEEATISLGNAFLQAKQYDQSEKQFKAAAKLAPKDALPVYTLGQQYLSQGRLDEALTQLQKAKTLAPKDGNVYYALGAVYNAQENYMDAAIALQTSVQLKPDFPDANYELGVAYNGLNYTEGVQEQQTILNSSDYNLASQLSAITKPQIVSIDDTDSRTTFHTSNFGPDTPIWLSDTSLLTPNSSKIVTTVIQFSKNMDYSSVINIANWSISRGDNYKSGYYNYSRPVSSTDAYIPQTPESVTYDSTTGEATVNFRLQQNSNGNAMIDPMHLVFTFNGKDDFGQTMDLTANSIDGYADAPFGSIDTMA